METKTDKNALNALLVKINQHGDINDPNTRKPLVTLDDFFIGNNNPGSIGYNFYPDQPSPREFYEHFQNIRKKTGVYMVWVQVNDQIEPEDWPSTDTIWIITSASEDNVRNWLGERFQADDLLTGFPDNVRSAGIEIPAGMRPIGVWWD